MTTSSVRGQQEDTDGRRLKGAPVKRKLMTRVAVLAGWLLCVALLGLWLVEAVHRGHLSGVLIVGTGLAALLIVPLMTARLRS